MVHQLIRDRDQLIKRADRALDAAWPTRSTPEFISETLACIKEMEPLATKMRAEHPDIVEQSRTYRLLGALYADLVPARGKQMLSKAIAAYSIAEDLLLGQDDELERAKLNFNYANALRQLDPNNIRQLEEAKQRFLAARGYFAMNAPEYVERVDQGLQSVAALLRIASLSAAVESNARDMEALQKELAAGGNVMQIGTRVRELMGREGGAAGLIGRLSNILQTLPEDQKQSESYAQIKSQIEALSSQAISEEHADAGQSQILAALRQRLEAERARGSVTEDRAGSITGLLQGLERHLTSGREESLPDIMEDLQGIRALADSWIEALHYPSYGLPRPPVGSRTAVLVESCWQLRRFLAEEMNRSGNGPDESRATLELSIRATNVDRRFYQVGADNERAGVVEREDLRPLAVAVREFSARKQPMLARPIWSTAKVPVATNEMFYSGPTSFVPKLAEIADRLGLQLQPRITGESPAGARWTQLRKAMTTIFDLRSEAGPSFANVTYELGIALALGKPVVVLIQSDQLMPFDVDVAPIVLTGSTTDNAALEAAIDQSLVWLYPRLDTSHVVTTVDHILGSIPRPHANTYIDQTLRLLGEQRDTADPIAVGRTLAQLVNFLEDDKPMLIHPVWSPIYPSADVRRLFHVMPFRPDWANKVAQTTRRAVQQSDGKYVRGDEVKDPNVIGSIWAEVAQASHILVDMTGFNPNVALELGIAHTLGRKVCMVCQGEPNASVFPSISKLRIDSYDMTRLDETLMATVTSFMST